MLKQSKCSNSNVKKDTFQCERVIYNNKNFIVAFGKYKENENDPDKDMIAMRWIINSEKDVQETKLKQIGFPFNAEMKPVWLTVPDNLVNSLLVYFEGQSKIVK